LPELCCNCAVSGVYGQVSVNERAEGAALSQLRRGNFHEYLLHRGKLVYVAEQPLMLGRQSQGPEVKIDFARGHG
jgi:hypothetical protein